MSECCYCKKEFEPQELRPYGPNGSLTCFNCAFATPEREAQTTKTFNDVLDAAFSVSNSIVVGEPTGPRPVYKPSKGN